MEKYDFSTPKQVVFADTDNIGNGLLVLPITI